MSRTTLIALSLFLLVESLFGFATYYSFSSEVGYRLKFRETQLDTAVESITSSYGRLVEAIFQKEVNTRDIIEHVAAAEKASPKERNRLRGRLYRRMYPTFKLLQDRKIRVLQFLLTDGTSFLRMNRPDLYGDTIADDRPLLRRVLVQGHHAQGFEHGRVYPGFRNAFPLLKDGQLVGVVDFSVAFDALYDVLSSKNRDAASFSQFLLRKDLVEAVSHPSVRSLFRDTTVHPEFVIEDESSSMRDVVQIMEAPPYLEPLDLALGADPDVDTAMREGRTLSLYKCIDNFDCHQVVLLSVKDSAGRPAAYVVGSFPGDEYPVMLRNHLIVFALGSLLFFLGGRSYQHWLRSRQQLQTISENMVEGLYVMNNQGNIVFSNKAAQNLLGFSKHEMQGKNGHNLFHHHSADQPVTAQNCPMRTEPMSGNVYRSSNETFTHRSGSLIRTEVTSSPLRDEGSIAGAVVLFRDITQDFENRIRQQQTETAFQNMSEAIMVTDMNVNIVAVNRAFTEITGYGEKEVQGKNPNILSSGMHDPSFYQEMWVNILQDGYWEGEIFNRRKDGDVYPEWLNITTIRDNDGEVLSHVAVFSDITDKLKKEKRLQELAYMDQLTNLPNRTSFMHLFDQALKHSKRMNVHAALLYLDLDHFKQINDTLGHQVGDKLLLEVGKRLQRFIRQDDVVARLGGDEFIIMIEAFDQEDDPARVANKLLQCFREPFSIEGRSLHISASIGISIYPEDGEDSTTLLKNADAAMYRAKRKGRGNYSYFTEDMAREAEELFVLETDLRHALRADDQLYMVYQPKFSLEHHALVGAEALIRWQHPERGLISPLEFLPAAHDASLMPEITDLVIRQVARQIRAWNELNIDPGTISFNLDGQTIKSIDLSSHLQRIVRDEGISPGKLEIEITETVILEQTKYSNLYKDLIDAGFTISIDDFGTGESSLFRLKHLPFNTLKIDRIFIKDVEHDENDLAILRSIVEMADSLGKKVLCEGVENASQLSLLNEIGCDEIQGYYLAKPMRPEEITRFYSEFEPEEFVKATTGDGPKYLQKESTGESNDNRHRQA
ncbi:MAG: EAL domain-containing protein [Candidatus Thiodiazotropha taylori]